MRGLRLCAGAGAQVQVLVLLALLVAEPASGKGANGGGPSPPPGGNPPPPPPANDACTPNPCLHSGQCTVSNKGFRCSCTGQHTGTTCQKGPCPAHSSDPTHSKDPPSCRCAPGYDTDGSGTPFEIMWDIDKGAWGGTCTASKCADRPVEHSDHDEGNPCQGSTGAECSYQCALGYQDVTSNKRSGSITCQVDSRSGHNPLFPSGYRCINAVAPLGQITRNGGNQCPRAYPGMP